MAATNVSAKLKDGDRVCVVSYDFGETLTEMEKKFGADVVRTNARANMIIGLQSRIRTGLKNNMPDSEIQEKIVNPWKPGTVSAPISDPVGAFMNSFENSDPEKQKVLFEKLKKLMAGQKG